MADTGTSQKDGCLFQATSISEKVIRSGCFVDLFSQNVSYIDLCSISKYIRIYINMLHVYIHVYNIYIYPVRLTLVIIQVRRQVLGITQDNNTISNISLYSFMLA